MKTLHQTMLPNSISPPCLLAVSRYPPGISSVTPPPVAQAYWNNMYLTMPKVEHKRTNKIKMKNSVPAIQIKAHKAFRPFQCPALDAVTMQMIPVPIPSHRDYAPVWLKSPIPLIDDQIENFLLRTSSALASSWKPLAINPAEAALFMAALLIAPLPMAAPVPRGLLVALLLPAALVGSEFDGVGFGCSSAERLALLPVGGDCESARGGGVEACTEGRGPGIVRPAPPAFSCSCCKRGDSSFILICARCGDLCCGGPWL